MHKLTRRSDVACLDRLMLQMPRADAGGSIPYDRRRGWLCSKLWRLAPWGHALRDRLRHRVDRCLLDARKPTIGTARARLTWETHRREGGWKTLDGEVVMQDASSPLASTRSKLSEEAKNTPRSWPGRARQPFW